MKLWPGQDNSEEGCLGCLTPYKWALDGHNEEEDTLTVSFGRPFSLICNLPSCHKGDW